ncbi:MAG: glycosyl hydrolase [Actinomycetota bacterium]
MSTIIRRAAGVMAVVVAVAGGGLLGHTLSTSRALERAAGAAPAADEPPGPGRPAASARIRAGRVRAPAGGTLYWGAYRAGAPYRHSLVTGLENEVGSAPALLMWYQEWDERPDFPAQEAAWLDGRGIVPVVSWEPWRPPSKFGDLVVEQPAYRLSRIAAGAFDSYVRKYARQVRAYGGPVMLRPFHEMDGFWYPWGITVNGNSAEGFVAAWRHIHDIFREVGATNVTWIWSVNHVSVPDTTANDVRRFWPGDSYVDWTGISGFNWGRASPLSVWKGIEHVIGARYALLSRYDKPIALMETGAPERGGNKSEWIRTTFARVLDAYPKLRALIWYDKRDSSIRDWRIASSRAALTAFRRAVANPLVLDSGSASEIAYDGAVPLRVNDSFTRDSSDGWGGDGDDRWALLNTAGQVPRLTVEDGTGIVQTNELAKGLLVVGPRTGQDVELSATFVLQAPESTNKSNHWQLVSRVSNSRSYYAFQLFPERGQRATLSIFRAEGGQFRNIATGTAPFVMRPGVAYRMRAETLTSLDGVLLRARVWPATDPEPTNWAISGVDTSRDQLLVGRVGLRYSMYADPERLRVDDFEARRA